MAQLEVRKSLSLKIKKEDSEIFHEGVIKKLYVRFYNMFVTENSLLKVKGKWKYIFVPFVPSFGLR